MYYIIFLFKISYIACTLNVLKWEQNIHQKHIKKINSPFRFTISLINFSTFVLKIIFSARRVTIFQVIFSAFSVETITSVLRANISLIYFSSLESKVIFSALK